MTETTFEAALRERLLASLGLDRSFLFPHEAIAYPVAVGHEQRKPGVAPTVARPWPLPRAVNAAGGVIATVGDLLRFAALHLKGGEIDGERLLSEASVRTMQEARTPAANFAEAYGIGWALRTVGDERFSGTADPGAGEGVRDRAADERGTGERSDARHRALGVGPLPRLEGRDAGVGRACRRRPGRVRRAVRAAAREGDGRRRRGGLRLEVVSISPITHEETVLPPLPLRPIGPREFVVTAGEGEGLRVDFVPGEGGAPRFLRAGGRLADRVDA